MAAKKKSSNAPRDDNGGGSGGIGPTSSGPIGPGGLDPTAGLEADGGQAGQTTGRMIVTAVHDSEAALDDAVEALSRITGLSAKSSNVCSTADFADDGVAYDQMETANFVRFEALGVAIVNGDPEAMQAASTASMLDDGVVVEPELWNYPLGHESTVGILSSGGIGPVFDDDAAAPEEGRVAVSRDYLLGARAMIDMLLEGRGSGALETAAVGGRCFQDTSQFTWGLQATQVHQSPLSGRGVRVAVLDSGFDAGHPDFANRSITRRSFIPANEPDSSPDDRSRHGTHCVGTSCGSRNPGVGPRYGVAFGAEIFAGKVLRLGANGRTSGTDGWILAGIDWALSNGCHIISMSLGSPATTSQFPMAYERAAQRGLRAGTLIVAATGNDSKRRLGYIAPVGRPANCPSIASVAAVDSCLRVADFGNGQRFANGGEVNFAAPGVRVLSSVPVPQRRAVFDGTSMATPHVAGIAALVREETGLGGIELYRNLRARVLPLGNSRDFGNGLCRV